MKVLDFNGFVKLPDNFDGSVSDGLRYFADYLDNPQSPSDVEGDGFDHKNLTSRQVRDLMWDRFKSTVEEGRISTVMRQIIDTDSLPEDEL